MPPRRQGRSESMAWARVKDAMWEVLQQHDVSGPVQRILTNVFQTADNMLDQVLEGVHVNPPLVIWPNPPRRNPLPGTAVRADELLSTRVYELAYRHDEDGQDYKHKFAPGVDLYTASMHGNRIVVLSRPDGRELWDDF